LFQGFTKAGQTIKVNPLEFVQQYSDPRDADKERKALRFILINLC
jgi:hypothetical protein